MAATDYNVNPTLNTAISGINLAEGCNASGVNDAIRQMMADIASLIQNGTLHQSGELAWFGRATAPAGWLVCDGSAVSRATYAALFAAVGSTYGAGDGSTTFNLPDMRGRGLVGAGTGAGLSTRVLGATGGEETHTLSVAETPVLSVTGSTGAGTAHTHAVTDPGHAHNFTDYTTANVHPNSSGVYQGGDPHLMSVSSQTDVTATAVTGITLATEGAHTHTTSGSTNGGGGAHNNMQPFMVGTICIKT